MKQSMVQQARLHLLRSFFESLENWKADCRVLGLESMMTQQSYDDLLKGTNASVSVVLWASAALSGEPVLLNSITRDVIGFYKACGYHPVRMDGNPPDYIGEQFRFLEYLTVCAQKGTAGFEEKKQLFMQRFAIDTINVVCRDMEAASQEKDVHTVIGLMRDLIMDREDGIPDCEEWLSKLDSTRWEAGKPLKLEAERVVSHASYNDCGSKCKMLSRVQEGCVLSIEPDSQCEGYAFTGCPRGWSYPYTFLNTGRLRYPMERIGKRGEGRFRRISWKEACEKIAAAIKHTSRTYGPESRYVMTGSGIGGVVRGDRFVKELLCLDGGYLSYYNSYSVACTACVLPYVYGEEACGNVNADMLNTRLLVLWGHNPVDTHWGIDHLDYLKKAKEQGVRIIVIDPRYTDTAMAFADEWIPIRPSTDGAMADAMAYVIQREGLQDQHFLDTFCIGYDEAHMPEGIPEGESYLSYLLGKKDGIVKTPEWAEAITGVPAERIERLAIEYATTKPACLMPGLGPQRTMNGEQTCRGFAVLACMTGNVGIAGGGSGGYAYRKSHDTPYFVQSPNPYAGSIPVFLWTKAADCPEKITPQEDGLRGVEKLRSGIKLIFNIASGMLMNQHSNVNDTARILKEKDKVETIVLSDLFMTPSARFADIVLPAPSFFESENIVQPWTAEDYLLYNHPAIPPLFESRVEFEWVKDTAAIMEREKEFLQGREHEVQWLEYFYEKQRKAEPELPPFEAFRERSYFFYQDRPHHIAFKENIEQGIPFKTESGKIEIFSRRLYAMGNPRLIPGIPSYTPCEEGPQDMLTEKYPLQLIGYHSKRRCHSMHDNNIRMDELEMPVVWLHPEDAEKRRICDGDSVEVFNDRGVVLIKAFVTERIIKGTAAMAEGGWYTPDAKGRDTRGCINVLTMTHRSTPLAKGNPQHTNLVEIRKLDQ